MSQAQFDAKYLYSKTSKALGKGAFGSVILGSLQSDPTTKVAIKTTKFTAHEAKAVKELRHPNIITTFNIAMRKEEDNTMMMMIAMESADRYGSLAHPNSPRKINPAVLQMSLSSPQMLQSILFNLTNAVSYMHKKNWAHKDLYLVNILLSNDKVVKLVDFELATSPLKASRNFQDMWILGITFVSIAFGFSFKHFEIMPDGEQKKFLFPRLRKSDCPLASLLLSMAELDHNVMDIKKVENHEYFTTTLLNSSECEVWRLALGAEARKKFT